MMKRWLSYLSFVFLPQLSAHAASKDSEDLTKPLSAIVYRCHDGDTCHVGVAEGMWMNVRLAGIDAPEVSNKKKKAAQEYGGESRDYINTILQGKSVQLRQVDLDPYNRPVVEILLDGKNINLTMVSEGYAEMYRGKTKRLDRKAYEAAEKEAKEAKKGIWKLAHYVSPKDFRDQQKDN